MDPTPAYEIAPMLLEAGEPSLPPRSRFAVPFGVFALVGIGAVFAYVVGSPVQVHRAGFEDVVEFAAQINVNVKTLDGDDFTIVAEGVDTIDNLKSKLSDKTGVPPEGFSLHLNSQDEELQGDSSLDDAGIDSSSRVFMIMRMDCPRPSAGGGSHAMALRRVRKEAERVSKECGDVVSFAEDSSDPMTWHLSLKGPAGSPYDGGNFPLTVSFPTKYPFQPPSLAFDTPIYHLNVESDGFVCFPPVSKEQYRPRANVCSILHGLSGVLESPGPDSAARPELAILFKENKAKYLEQAKASVGS